MQLLKSNQSFNFMTFYNPNIQSVFDSDSSLSAVLHDFHFSNFSLAIYHFRFDKYPVVDFTSITLDEQTNSCSLAFVSSFQLANMAIVDVNFYTCFLDIVSKSYQLHISTFAEYMRCNERISNKASYSDNVYIKDRIFDFIELLLYSDIANAADNCQRHDFHKYLDKKDASLRFPVYTTLYERLKLFNYLFDNIRFQVSNIRISPVSSIIYFDFSLWL